jgi:serine phosphatase RsbU (regulator of sigma subunit)/anti-sigma regulatory factor (Ser/Thr protein kinase)
MADTLDTRHDFIVASSDSLTAADEGLEVTTPATPEPSGARPKRAKAAEKAARSLRRGETESSSSTIIDIVIDDDDPLLDFLQSAPGPLDIAALPQFSPAVQRMQAQGVRVVVPLVTSGELVGVIALGARRSERTYTRADKRLLDSLARYAAPALRLGQLMREQEAEARERERVDQELHVAQLIQQQFLPHELPELRGWQVSAFYRPAATIGGDFYDLIELDDGRIMVVEGDVTGHGVPAALVMASTHALLRSTAEVTKRPGEVLRRVNQLLVAQIPENMFVTCLALVIDLDTGKTQFANAGHNLPYIRRGDDVIRLEARGMPLGLMADSVYDEIETQIDTDDIVLLYSDGITEQHDAGGEMFGFHRMQAVVGEATSGDELIDRSVTELGIFSTGVEQEDDITLVTLHRGRRGGYQETVTFAVPSEIGNERDVMDRIAEIVGDAIPDDRLAALKTAVSETAMNAIEHGNRALPDLDVTVSVRRSTEAITVEIADFGRGQQKPAETPDLDLKLAGLQTPRGWGLFLVNELVDKVEEFNQGDEHIVRLTMRIAPETPAKTKPPIKARPSTKGKKP